MLECVTTGTGYFKAGIDCTIVDGGERKVFLGPQGAEKATMLPEFTLEFTDEKGRKTRREFCQYGRDFVFKKGHEQ